jgi:hypothetical protein
VQAEAPQGEVGVRVGVDVGPALRKLTRAGYHLSDIFWFPESFGCTPSPVSVAVLNPVHWSTTTIGDCAVLKPLAHAGMSALKSMVRWAHSGQVLGFTGMI